MEVTLIENHDKKKDLGDIGYAIKTIKYCEILAQTALLFKSQLENKKKMNNTTGTV